MKCELSLICGYVNETIATSELSKFNYISTENMLPNKNGIEPASSLPNQKVVKAFKKGDILISNIRPYFKKIWLAEYNGGCSNDVLVIRAKKGTNKEFLYYLLSENKFFDYVTASSKGTKMPRGDKNAIMNYLVPEFEEKEQRKIAKLLGTIDKKIKVNKKINDNLEKQIMAIFQHMFGEKNKNRKNIRADEYFDISIGKTPPRKEPQWFSKNPSDYVWVSISDMGNCGLYIEDSSEHLSIDAVKMFNIKIVPDNTVILSFKLTVGRVAITDGYMTTNEAIAHFKTDKPKITEYLYCYLKNFNFQTMGSTSSIATAINSKIIKKMSFVVPTNEELEKFHNIAAPMFMLIKLNQRENKYMNELRDGLLPKLMSGEVDISNLNI